MNAGAYTLLLVGSTQRALRAEQLLQEAGIACKLIPVPRQIRSDCGLCLRVAHADSAAALQVLRAAGLDEVTAHDL
ncbi:MAG TPA: DUF3343 domain-containing protein [Armatimonadota bacterium]|nr:DUF3343 domain-containing protein [Armatimonadota bacterium]